MKKLIFICLVLTFFTGWAYGETAEELYKQGNDTKDLDQKIEYFDKAIALNPNYADAYHMRGHAREEKKDYEGAVADYSRWIEIDDTRTKAFEHRAANEMRLGNLDGALADYTRAIELSPRWIQPYEGRAEVRRKLGDNAGAKADTKMARLITRQRLFSGRGLLLILAVLIVPVGISLISVRYMWGKEFMGKYARNFLVSIPIGLLYFGLASGISSVWHVDMLNIVIVITIGVYLILITKSNFLMKRGNKLLKVQGENFAVRKFRLIGLPLFAIYIAGSIVSGRSSFQEMLPLVLSVIFIALCAHQTQRAHLMENGIVLSGIFYDWKKIKSFAFKGRNQGTLSLRMRGNPFFLFLPYETWIAVAPEQKEEITRILEKYIPHAA